MRRSMLFVIVLVSIVAVAQGSRPSSPEERTRAIQIAHRLEANPLDKSLKADAAWLLKFAAEASDFTVNLCTSNDELKKKYKYSPELTFQKMASATAFILEHPDQKDDAVAEEMAAVNGALNAYEAILKAEPQRHSEYWDELLQKRKDGSLKEFVTKYVSKNCSGKQGIA